MKRRTFLRTLAVAPALAIPQSARAQVGPALLALTIGVTASLVIIYLYHKFNQPKPVLHRIALQKSYQGGPWETVLVVEVYLTPEHPQAAFADTLIYSNSVCLYRALEVPLTPDRTVDKATPDWNTIPGVPVYWLPRCG